MESHQGAGAPRVWAGRYRLVRRLGAGGMASVWEAVDEHLGRSVAIKRLHVASDEGSRRFRREARLGASLRHRGLVTVFDVVTAEDDLLLVMELVDGESLAERIARGRLDRAEALRILREVATALDHAHAAGVVHRDVKPANILLGGDGRTRLADLGIARAAESTQITLSGTLLGTVAYLAPEQLEGAPASPASDIHALAAVAFEALSGRAARFGRTSVEVMSRIGTEPPPDLREAWPEAPAAAAAVLARGMARDPDLRPTSAGDLVDELEQALHESPPRTAGPREAPLAHPARPRRRTAVPALAGLALVVAAVAVILLTGGDRGGGGGTTERAAATPTATATATATPTATAATATAAGDSPESAVRGFYEKAAAGDYAAAWARAGPGMRRAFGDSLESFRRQIGTLRSIEFQRLDVSRQGDTATVTVRTVAHHSDRTDRCSGPLQVRRAADGLWRVDPGGIRCTSG